MCIYMYIYTYISVAMPRGIACITLQHTVATHCCSVLQCVHAICCSALQSVHTRTATHCNTLQHTTTHCNTLQHTATRYNALQHTSTHSKTYLNVCVSNHTHCYHLTDCGVEKRALAAIHYTTVHHIATHCNTLQHTATYLNALVGNHTHCRHFGTEKRALAVTHCNTLQHTAIQ